MSNNIKQSKAVDKLPEALEVNTIYYVKTREGFDMYITDRLGQAASPLNLPVSLLASMVYTPGVRITTQTQTVSYLGHAYRPALSALPFTTTGVFTAANFELIRVLTTAELASIKGAGFIYTAAKGEGSTSRSLQDISQDTINAKAAGALGDGVTDDGPSICTVHDNLPAFGGQIKISTGTYRVGAIGGSALTITKPVSLLGDGGAYTAFNPSLATINDNTISVTPVLGYDYTAMRISGLALHNPATGQRTGKDGIYVTTTAKDVSLAKFTLQNMYIGQGSNPDGFGFCHYNNGFANPNGGMFCALLENSVFKGGIKLDSSGDSISITHNILTGNQLGVLASLVAGASMLEIQSNNITADKGSIRIESGSRFRILGNSCKNYAPGAAGANSGAIINVNGAKAVLYGGVIKENLISVYGTSDAATLIRLRNCSGILVEDNVLLSAKPGVVGIDIGADCFDIRVGSNTFNAAIVTQIIDNGVGTMGVVKTAVLQNGWTALSPSFSALQYIKSSDGIVRVTGSVKGGIVLNETLVTTLPLGFRPSKTMRFPITKIDIGANGTSLPGVAVATLEPTGELKFSYSSISEMTVNFMFSAGNLGNSISLE